MLLRINKWTQLLWQVWHFCQDGQFFLDNDSIGKFDPYFLLCYFQEFTNMSCYPLPLIVIRTVYPWEKDSILMLLASNIKVDCHNVSHSVKFLHAVRVARASKLQFSIRISNYLLCSVALF